MKLVLKLAAAVVVLLIIVAVCAVFYVDSIAKSAVEYAGTDALGVDTTLSSIDVGIMSGKVSLTDLNVANPAGQDFNSPRFFHLKDASVAVSLGTLMKDKVVVPSLKLDGMEMNLEKKSGKANYQIIMDNLSKGEAKPTEPAEPGKAAPAKKFVIQELELTNITVSADLLPLGGALTKTKLTIPKIRLTDVGSESEGGVVLKDLSGIIIKAIMQAVIDKSGDLPASMVAELGKGLGGLKDIQAKGLETIGGVSDDLNKTIGEAAKGVGDVSKSVDEVTKGLGDLFGGKKKDDKKTDEKK